MKDRKNITLQLDGVPYYISVEACEFNSGLQYRVWVNEGEEVMFVFDNELGRYTAVGNDSVILPDILEQTIGTRLNGLSLDEQRNV